MQVLHLQRRKDQRGDKPSKLIKMQLSIQINPNFVLRVLGHLIFICQQETNNFWFVCFSVKK